MTSQSNKPTTPVSLGLSFTAGFGFTTMAAALALGVIGGDKADGGTIGLLFVGGLALFVVGVAGWVAVVQPHKHFDDINQPMDAGHHHEEHETHSAH